MADVLQKTFQMNFFKENIAIVNYISRVVVSVQSIAC